MKISHAGFLFAMLCMPSTGRAAQSAANGVPINGAAIQEAAPALPAQSGPSRILQPSLDGLKQAIGEVNLEKWKGGTVRAEAGTNITSMLRDLQSTLPTLLAQADQAPNTVSRVLPVSRNINALYDVLLRVVDGARIAAPSDQFAQLQNAMTALEKAREALEDQVRETAAAQEKRVDDLQIALKAQSAPACPVTPTPPAPTANAARKTTAKKRKPAAKPAATPQPSSSQPAGSAKPNQ